MEPWTDEVPYRHNGYPQNPLNPSLNPNNISTFVVENPNDHVQEPQHYHHPISTRNVADHHVINNVACNNNNSTFQEIPNGHYQETQHYYGQTIATDEVANDVASNNVGLSKEEWQSEYPPGYKFCPDDGELIYYYLRRKILNLSLPHNKIHYVELYKTTPQEVTALYKPVQDNDWYFFTPRDRKYPNGKRPNRSAGGQGYWKATGADKKVFFQDQLVGYRKALVYYKNKASAKKDKTNWIMHEFRIVETTERQRIDKFDMKLDDCVLCKIYHKSGNGSTGNGNRDMDKEHSRLSPTSEIDSEAEADMVVEDKSKVGLKEDEDYNNYNGLFEEVPGYLLDNFNNESLDSILNCPTDDLQSWFFDLQSDGAQPDIIIPEVKPLPSDLLDDKLPNALLHQEPLLFPGEQNPPNNKPGNVADATSGKVGRPRPSKKQKRL